MRQKCLKIEAFPPLECDFDHEHKCSVDNYYKRAMYTEVTPMDPDLQGL